MIDFGFVVVGVFAVTLGGWWMAAQDEYLRAHAVATGTAPQTREALARRLIRPWQLLTSAPLTNIFRAMGTRQTDPVLEALRQKALTRRWVSFAAIFLAFLGYSLLRTL
jgi:hypothetical protein